MKSQYQNNFDNLSSLTEWYSDAAGVEFQTTWGDLPLFRGDIRHLEFMRCQTIWMESTLEDMNARRRAVMAFARSVLSPTDFPDAELLRWFPLFPVEAVSPKLADAICTLYNTAPYREFSLEQGMQTAFTELYDTFEVNHVMKDAYRMALFTNTVLLLPDWDTKKIKVLTPDFFRFVGEDELWIAKGSGGWREKEFEVWTPETATLMNHSGKPIKSEANPYGRIPAVKIKLNRSNDIYGSGISEAAEISVWSNFIRFISTRIGVFQSFSVGVAVNLDLKPGTRIGPGYIINSEMKMGDGVPPPSLTYVSPDGKFVDLEKYRQDVVRSFERNNGLPGFMVDEGAGQPPTGAALQVLERQLNEKRNEHSYALIKAEKDLCSLLSQQAAMYGQRSISAPGLSVQYADAQTFGDPQEELTYDQTRKAEGLLSPSAYVLKYTNQRMTDEQAVAFLEKNKAYFSTKSIEPTV